MGALDNTILIGLDIGGTKFLAASTDQSGKILKRVQAPTPAGLEEGLALLIALAREVADGGRIAAIGAACGGPLDAEQGIVSPLHQPNWRSVPLRAVMETAFDCPFRVEVDTDAGALAEYRFGPLQSERLLYLTLSTGMGGGLLIGGEIYRGFGGAHPEAGHQAIPYRLRNFAGAVECECGATGCLEALVSGNGIRRIYGKKAEDLADDEWSEVGCNLGMGLRNLAVLYTPEVIVLGGGLVAGSGGKFLPVAEAVMREGLRLTLPPRVLSSSLGYDTALLGAIALAQNAAKI